jgi:hypothetical protein
MADKQSRGQAQQTFRQFAWNLAGTLGSGKGSDRPAQASPRKGPGGSKR